MLTAIILIVIVAVMFGVSFIVTSKLLQKKNNSHTVDSIKPEAAIEEDGPAGTNYCPHCGKILSKSAKFCSECGKFVSKDRPKKKVDIKATIIFIALVLFAIVILLSIIFPKDSDSTAKPATVVKEPTAATEHTLPSIGDTLELDGIKVKFDRVKESNGSQFVEPENGNVFVLCEFTIENNSSSDIGISSMMSFECYVDDYATSISLNALMDDTVTKQLDGNIAPGKKMRGYIGYEAPRNWSDIEIHFIPYLGSTHDLVFYCSK